MELRHALGFAPEEADDLLVSIHILGLESGQIGLRCAQMPRQFVEGPTLRVLLTRDNGAMLG